MKEKKNWRDTVADINLKKVFVVVSLAITFPVFYYFYFVDETSLFMSLVVTFMTLWAIGLALMCGLILIVGVLQALSIIFEATKPILRWFLR